MVAETQIIYPLLNYARQFHIKREKLSGGPVWARTGILVDCRSETSLWLSSAGWQGCRRPRPRAQDTGGQGTSRDHEGALPRWARIPVLSQNRTTPCLGRAALEYKEHLQRVEWALSCCWQLLVYLRQLKYCLLSWVAGSKWALPTATGPLSFS